MRGISMTTPSWRVVHLARSTYPQGARGVNCVVASRTGLRGGAGGLVGARGFLGGDEREVEGAAGARRAFDADGAAVLLDDALADDQAESGAAGLARRRRIELGELLEQLGQVLGGDALAVVAHR